MLVNNQEAQLVRYDNYQFGIKTFGKQAACFVCTNNVLINNRTVCYK
jgi:hypothetical protein